MLTLLTIELAWILFNFACWLLSSQEPRFTKNKDGCFCNAGKIQVFLPGEPIYSKICFLGKAEMEQLNYPMSWRNAITGSWLGATWNEEWWISFLEDWLDSCLDQWGKKKSKFLFGSIMKKKDVSFSWLLVEFCGPSWIFNQVGACTYEKMQSKQIPTTLLMIFCSETERFLLCHLRSGLRDAARKDGWGPVSFCFHCVF